MKGFRNCNVYVEGKGVIKTSIIIEKGKIVSFEDNQNTELMQLDDNLIVIPGLIDEHIHGANNSDAMDGSVAALENIARTLAKEGVTSFLATTMTQSSENITSALKAVKEYKELNLREGACLLGVHLEGPFISKQFIGAQPLEYVAEPSVEIFRNYQAASGNNIRIVTLAPEEGAESLIKYLVANNIIASIGHTNASYEDVQKAVNCGASNVTHTYNAMKPLHHREIGTVGSAFLFDELTAEVICDGIHVSAPALRVLYKNKPKGKMVLISDAMRAKHMPDGEYELGGQPVFVKDNQARLANGVLAGSVLKLNNAVANAMNFLGISFTEAVDLATINVARNLNIDSKVGSINIGKQADLTVVDCDMNVYLTIRNGHTVFQKQ
jgi:N-acetylglucosamine-6-phosphate deacetylase